MNQDNKNDDLQKAINEVTQKDTTETTPAPIISQHNTGISNNVGGDDATVAAAMASVLPDNKTNMTPTSSITTNNPQPTPTSDMGDVNISVVKEQALRELSPLLDKTQLDPESKFRIYRDMIETLHENSLLMPTLEVAKQIQDETARAEALLYLVNLIDDLGIK